MIVLPPPSITQQPQSQPVSPGQTATLSVAAIGSPPLSYQWYLGQSGDSSQPIGGATSASYTTGPLSSTVSYWLLVSNSADSASSATAVINVLTPPLIPPPPQSQPVSPGQTASLSVAAIGSPPLSYQWYL